MCFTKSLSSRNLSTMKVTIVLLSLVSLGLAAPQSRSAFVDHFNDFMDIIKMEAREDIMQVLERYSEFEDFQAGVNYLRENSFRELFYEMESLPEFKAVIDFLERDNIDIRYFIDLIHDVIDKTDEVPNKRQELRDNNLTAFIIDVTMAFPKEKLAALFDQKIAEDEKFRISMENLSSEEWRSIYEALFLNEVFQKEVQTLADHGIMLEVVLNEIKAVFGQN